MNELGLPTTFGPQRRRITNNDYAPNKKRQIPVDYDVEETFNKSFSFFPDKNICKWNICQIPEPSLLFIEDKWKLDAFQDLKTDLNNTKSKLNDLNLKDWHLHTTNTNIAGDVMKKLRHLIGPEFLTQAWCKMYECLMSFCLIPKTVKDSVFNSVHLCEAPGAFITALNHFLQTWYPDAQWNWLATTLNPYHESNPLSHMIQDDRLILHTLPHWTFGSDGTGNLMDMDNLQHLQFEVQNKLQGNVLLVTADGSVDCQINPAEQEALVAPLHYCETLTALSILQPGGSFMLKMFTLLECDSICLLYLLVCVFNTVNVFKPVKSKEGNSEVYILCTEYIGKNHLEKWMPTLMEKFGPSTTKAMFSVKDIPEEFKNQMYECAKKFCNLQVRVIERNLDLFHFPSPPKLFCSRMMKRRVAERYIEHYDIQPVRKVIVGNDVLADTPTFNLAQKYEEGTFNDRLRKAHLDKYEHTMQLWASVQALGCHWPYKDTVCWFVFNKCKLPPLDIMFGQPVLDVKSSKFCNGSILDAYNQVPSAHLIIPMKTEVETSITVDVSQFPWDSCSSHCHLLLLECVSRALKNLPANKSLCIRGLPLLTQFSVAVVFLLAHSFYQVGLSVEGNVILCGYEQARSSATWIHDVLRIIHDLPSNIAVLSILPINILCGLTSLAEVPGDQTRKSILSSAHLTPLNSQNYQMKDGGSFYMSVSSINNARLLQALEKEVYRVQQRNNVSM